VEPFTDEQMRTELTTTKPYSVAILRAGPNRTSEGADAIAWEHGRRNFSLRADGRLAIVCPVTDKGDMVGVSIFNLGPDETRAVMDDDPAVAAGVIAYEVFSVRSFPGDALPG
jgi:hypothetical protein